MVLVGKKELAWERWMKNGKGRHAGMHADRKFLIICQTGVSWGPGHAKALLKNAEIYLLKTWGSVAAVPQDFVKQASMP